MITPSRRSAGNGKNHQAAFAQLFQRLIGVRCQTPVRRDGIVDIGKNTLNAAALGCWECIERLHVQYARSPPQHTPRDFMDVGHHLVGKGFYFRIG